MGSDGLEPRLCRVELSTVQVMLYMELIYFGHLILLREALYMYYLRLSTKAPPSLDSAFDLCLGRSRGHQLRSFFQV